MPRDDDLLIELDSQRFDKYKPLKKLKFTETRITRGPFLQFFWDEISEHHFRSTQEADVPMGNSRRLVSLFVQKNNG